MNMNKSMQRLTSEKDTKPEYKFKIIFIGGKLSFLLLSDFFTF